MKDFLKIFILLVVVVFAFVSGRNYGETIVKESPENKKSESQLVEGLKAIEENKIIKDKLQVLLNDSANLKTEEFHRKIMTFLLVDLGLSSPQVESSAQSEQSMQSQPSVVSATSTPSATIEKKERPFSKLPLGRFKSTEWTLVNSKKDLDIFAHLQKINILSIDQFSRLALPANEEHFSQFSGTYRGRVTSVDGGNYGSIIIEVTASNKNVKIYRDGREEISTELQLDKGLVKIPEGYLATLIDLQSRYLQIYKIQDLEKIAGHFYERLPNGTTKLIGSFVLNRTDKI